MLEVCDLVVKELGINASPLEKEQLVSRYIEGWSAMVTPVPGAVGSAETPVEALSTGADFQHPLPANGEHLAEQYGANRAV